MNEGESGLEFADDGVDEEEDEEIVRLLSQGARPRNAVQELQISSLSARFADVGPFRSGRAEGVHAPPAPGGTLSAVPPRTHQQAPDLERSDKPMGADDPAHALR